MASESTDRPVRVLMVCLGNICRSTMAESTFRHLAASAGLGGAIEVDSAGTGSWHVGAPPHPETHEQLVANGIDVGDGRARQVQPDDLHEFDYVIAMDGENLSALRELVESPRAELSLLLEHAEGVWERDVPDPYLVGGYDRVFDLVHAGCMGLLDHVADSEGLVPD